MKLFRVGRASRAASAPTGLPATRYAEYDVFKVGNVDSRLARVASKVRLEKMVLKVIGITLSDMIGVATTVDIMIRTSKTWPS